MIAICSLRQRPWETARDTSLQGPPRAVGAQSADVSCGLRRHLWTSGRAERQQSAGRGLTWWHEAEEVVVQHQAGQPRQLQQVLQAVMGHVCKCVSGRLLGAAGSNVVA